MMDLRLGYGWRLRQWQIWAFGYKTGIRYRLCLGKLLLDQLRTLRQTCLHLFLEIEYSLLAMQKYGVTSVKVNLQGILVEHLELPNTLTPKDFTLMLELSGGKATLLGGVAPPVSRLIVLPLCLSMALRIPTIRSRGAAGAFVLLLM